ncbi:MAG: lyase [Alphaproteobacteria bacterium]|nr:lyase [Alphaproteobacteria bacterium]
MLALTCAAGAATAADLSNDGPVAIDEWKVPYEESRPRDPFAASGDEVWFVGQRTGYLAKLDVETGEFSKVDLKEGEGPHNLIVASDGIVWYAGNRTGVIGRYDPSTEMIEEVAMPDPAARDPHTLVLDEGEENIWFTVQGGNFMGRLAIESRKVDLIPSMTPGSRPYGIKMGPEGDVWVVLFGANKLAHIDPQTLELTEIELPREGARPRRLEVGADGRVWYVDYAEGMLGAYDPATEAFDEWPLPGGEGSRPYGTAMDADGDVWLVETGVSPNRFVGFDPDTETFFGSADVPSGGGTIRHMHYHAPSGAVWFGTDTN